MPETDLDRKIAELRSALVARSDTFEASMNARFERLESSFNTRVEKLEESVAGLILTGEYPLYPSCKVHCEAPFFFSFGGKRKCLWFGYFHALLSNAPTTHYTMLCINDSLWISVVSKPQLPSLC